MPWQQQVLDVAMEIDTTTGKLAYREVILTVPRQSGKTTLLLSLILLWALAKPRQNIRYTAQTGSDARNKWMDDWLPVLQSSPFSKQFKPRLTNGHEALLFKNGSQQGLLATTKKAGHGGSIDLAILDESFAHPDARLEQAMRPAMVTRPAPQLWVVSTAGTPDDSPYLLDKVEAGRQLVEADVRTGTAYFEWSADDKADPADEATWWSCMPALGRTVPIEAIRADFQSMCQKGKLSEFRRAYLNQWVSTLHDPVIPLDRWAEALDGDSEMLNPVAFAFDVAPDRSWSAISAAGRRPDGKWHVEVIDHRAGTGWVPGRLKELKADHRPLGIWCDPAGPAGGLVAAAKALGVEVLPVGAREHAAACGALYDLVMDEDGPMLRHLGTPELLTALDGASKRPLGDAWAWSRTSSAVDISPLVATTLALHGAMSGTDERDAEPHVIDLAALLAEEQEEAAR